MFINQLWKLQFLIDLIFFTCLNIKVLNMSEKKNTEQSILPCLAVQPNWRSDRENVQSLMRRLKENKRKENIGRFIFMTTAISIFVISGIIISF
jgi:N-acetylglutamate synthase-like GNAT family acetyltransferase